MAGLNGMRVLVLRVRVLALVAALAAAGCAPLAVPPADTSTQAPTSSAASAASATSATSAASTTSAASAASAASAEYPSPPPSESAAGGASDPAQAVREFAERYINWSAQTVAADMDALAAASIGQARSAVQLAAAETAHDYELQSGGISNSGTVEAVAPLPRRSDQYVVVTLEQTTATATNAYQGLRPAWHVALATVVELTPGRWVVSGWQPES